MKWRSLLLFWGIVVYSAIAQQPTAGEGYRGHVSTSKGDAVEYATAILLRDGVQVGGTVTDSDGNFAMEAGVGRYQLVVQCIGFESLRKEVVLPLGGLDSLMLGVSTYALQEMVVQAKHIERKADRFVISVLPSTGKDGTELLSQAPGVWLADGNISINGAQGTKVFVDDREIRLTGEELLSYLRSLRSDDIKRIEVIPIAGSEYDATMRGGIVQILLRRRPDNGVQGNVSLGMSLSPSLQGYLPSAAVSARLGKWSLSTAVSGILLPKNKGEMSGERLYVAEGSGFSSNSKLDDKSRYGNGRLSTIFEMDSLNSVGAEMEYIRQTTDGISFSQTELVKAGYPIRSQGHFERADGYHTFSTAINYIRKMDDRGSSFKLIADYVNKRSTGDNDHQITYRQPESTNDTTYRSHAGAEYDMATFDLSYQKYIRERMSFTVGAKYTYSRMDDHSFYEGLGTDGIWIPNETYAFTQKYNENIGGAYASFSADVKRWSFVVGLRAEYAKTSDRYECFDRDYLDLFPNVNVTYAFDRMKKWMLVGQYARNIERPAFYTLNPNRVQTSDYSYQIGNPYLRPTYIHRFSATWVYNYRYTLTLGGDLHRDLIREFSKQDASDPDVSYVTYENHDVENHWFVAVNLPFQPFSWLNLTGNFVGVRQDIRMMRSSFFATHYLAFANAIAAVRLPGGYMVEAQYNGRSRLYSGNSEVAPRHTLGVVARKKFVNDRLLLTASVNNLFNRENRYASNLEAYRMEMGHEGGMIGRMYKVTLTWSFNSGKKLKKEKMEVLSGSERNRLHEK